MRKTPSKPVKDWRAQTLERMRKLIKQAEPDIVEEVKWRKPSNNMAGVPVWSLNGIICTGETHKTAVKLTFAKGASLPDPAGLFNASLEGNTRRAIDIHEGEKIDEKAFKALIRSAVEMNAQKPAKSKAKSQRPVQIDAMASEYLHSHVSESIAPGFRHQLVCREVR